MVSGGLDSFLAANQFPKAKRVFVEWGQPYLELERRAVALLHPGAEVVRVDGAPIPEDCYIPARNLMFATIGVRFGSEICLAGMRDEMCADKSPDAFRDMTDILTKQCKKPTRVFSPFWNVTKAEAVRSYLAKGGDPELLCQTVSCYGSGQKPCLDCEACFRRFVALASNGVPVPRPTEAVVRAYGLNRLVSAPAATVHDTLRALHLSGSPVHALELTEDILEHNHPYEGLRVVYTPKRDAPLNLIQKTLAGHGFPFDVVLTGHSAQLFQFS
jgi:7-cyano-7-deazaguanine synthase in queuosine biosynthesis